MALIPARNHEGITIIVIGAIFGALSISFFALRIWSRQIKGAKLDLSDYTLLTALILAIALIGGTVNTVIQGLGLEVDQVTVQQLTNLAKGLIIGILLWVFASSLVRISILLLYMNIFARDTFRHVSQILIALNLIYVVIVITVTFTICQPFAYSWDKTIPGGFCGDSLKFYTWMGVWNLISDLITVLLPLPVVWDLQMPIKKKLLLSAVFCVGLGICALTVVRTVQTAQASALNPTKDYAPIGILSLLEPLLGICSASTPFLGPVIHRVFGGTMFEEPKTTPVTKPTKLWSNKIDAAGKSRSKKTYRSLADLESASNHGFLLTDQKTSADSHSVIINSGSPEPSQR